MVDQGDSGPLRIVQAVPDVWGSGTEADRFARRLTAELASRGHRMLVVAPSPTKTAMRDGKRAVRAAQGETEGPFGDPGETAVLPIGGPPAVSGRRRMPVSNEATRLIAELEASAPIDLLHVHDPYTPSVPSTALRHSFSLNIGTFHLPQERLLSTQLARPLIEIFLGRLDARTAVHPATRTALQRYFPGSYDLVPGGADPGDGPAGTGADAGDEAAGAPLRIYYRATEERGALRMFLRGLRRLPRELEWSAVVELPGGYGAPPRVAAALRERIEFRPGPVQIAGHDVVCLTSSGARPAPSVIAEAIAAGAVPLASDLPLYADLLADGPLGLLFPPADPDTLAGQLTRLGDGGPAEHSLAAMRERGAKSDLAGRRWADVAGDLERIYRGTLARRHPPAGDPATHSRVIERELVEVDLHMHTDHSPDCATPVRVLLETARDRGLGAIAITDHNEISGALAAREVAAGMDGIEVIVAEEVKTAEQGEVIGLFLEEKIPRGMTMSETIAEIRRQGGLVYMPHPFDRLHSVPDYEHLVEVVEEIDFMEVFNPRIAISAFNEEAERFAHKYRIIPAAGSDSHVAQGLGSVRVRVPRFEGPQEFREAMRDAEITRRHKNLVYVQALKFLQTTGRPKAPKRELPRAAPVRGGRPSRSSRTGSGRTSRSSRSGRGGRR